MCLIEIGSKTDVFCETEWNMINTRKLNINGQKTLVSYPLRLCSQSN